MPYPIGLRPYGCGPPPFAMRSWITRCSFGLSPKPPFPSGKCTHASPRSNCAPRNAATSVVFGGFSSSSWSTSAITRSSSCSSAVRTGDGAVGALTAGNRTLTDRSSRLLPAPKHLVAGLLGLDHGEEALEVEPAQAVQGRRQAAVLGHLPRHDAPPLASTVEHDADAVTPRSRRQRHHPHLLELVPPDTFLPPVRQLPAHAVLIDQEHNGLRGGTPPPTFLVTGAHEQHHANHEGDDDQQTQVHGDGLGTVVGSPGTIVVGAVAGGSVGGGVDVAGSVEGAGSVLVGPEISRAVSGGAVAGGLVRCDLGAAVVFGLAATGGSGSVEATMAVTGGAGVVANEAEAAGAIASERNVLAV